MHDRGFPFATHGRTEMGIDHPYFDFDNEAFARIAVRELASRGRRRLALLAPPVEQSYARHMIGGFQSEAAAIGLQAHVLEGVTSDSPAAVIEEFAGQLFARGDRPDGLVLGATTSAMACVSGAETCGLRIGTDFDIAAKEAIRFLRRFRREIIVVHEDVSRAGDFLARAVMAAIEHPAPDVVRQCLDRPDRID